MNFGLKRSENEAHCVFAKIKTAKFSQRQLFHDLAKCENFNVYGIKLPVLFAMLASW